jgi:signal transduction histidine kinase
MEDCLRASKAWETDHALSAIATPIGIALVSIAYYCAARLGLFLAFEHTNASPVWPPSGIAVGLTLLFGYRVLPGVFIGAFIANIVVLSENHMNLTSAVLASSLIACGNTGESFAARSAVIRWIGDNKIMESARNAFTFILISLLACIVSATLGPLSLCSLGVVSWKMFPTVWFTWWLGDITGIVIFAPFFFVFREESWGTRIPKRVLEGAALVALLLGAGVFVFLSTFHHSLVYTLIPFLLWSAFRFGPRGVVITSFVISLIAIVGTVRGSGPFVTSTLNESMLLLQAFVGICAVTGLILAAVLVERRDALRQAKAHAAQLEIVNRELESFSYSVSHDLRSPLRVLDGFSKVLSEEYSDSLDEEGRRILGRICRGANRMARLIDDLLALARITKIEMRRQELNLKSMAQSIIADLRETYPNREIEIIVEDSLSLNADDQLLRIALENLLGNAFKFTEHTERASIKIGSEQQGNLRVYYVQDNGAGFDMKYSSKLFGAFQRLHSEREFPGNGIGLATVQRVIDRHGGRIWGKGEPGKGATFYFTVSGNLV